MLRKIGRSLQILALVVLPLAMVLQLTNSLGRQLIGREFSVSEMVVLLVFGVAAFGLGRLIEGYAAR